jgi:hypothetical protein
MRIGGLMLLMVMVAGAVVGMYAIAANLNTSPPVDSAGNTVSNATNMTQQNVTAIARVAPSAGAVIALILAVLVLASIVVYFAASNPGMKSRRMY